MLRKIADVVVVGAGPAGAHAAAIMARGGLNVILVDQNQRGGAGAQWLNDVPRWMFDAAGVRAPEASKHRKSKGDPFLLVSADGEHSLKVAEAPCVEVDMRALGAELADEVDAAPCGTTLWGVKVRRVDTDRRGRPVAVLGERDGEEVRLEAALFVDASGLSAVLRRALPAMAITCPPPSPEDLCSAAQEVREISDRHGAQRFLEQHGSAAGEYISRVGVEGGYSVLRVRVDPEMETISILTGALAIPKYRSGRRILRDFVDEHAWLGGRIFGGARGIPLRRPYTHLVSTGVALLGDAASQVYASHGSGIGVGLMAARLLGDVVAQAKRQGHDLGAMQALWPYASSFHQRWGGLLCFADLLRRLTQRLSQEESRALIERGFITQGIVHDGLAQRRPQLRPQELVGQLAAAWKAPELCGLLLPTLIRLPLLEAAAQIYYPEGHNARALDLYEVLIQTILRE